jgi:general nucleoside transport system permease protein
VRWGERAERVVVTVGLVLVASLLSGLVFRSAGYSGGEVVQGILAGAVTGRGAALSSLRWAVPLLLIALGVVISFRAGYFNIGAQGQFVLGGVSATAIGLQFAGRAPAVLVVIACLVGGSLVGAMWSGLAGVLRVRFGADEILTTLMLNFVGVLAVQYLVTGPMRNPEGAGQVAASRSIDRALRLSDSSGISLTIVALVVVVSLLTWVLLERTEFGLVLRIVGRNAAVARWKGVAVEGLAVRSFALSGALAGLAGAVEVLGPAGRTVAGSSPTVGFTAIIVAIVGLLTIGGVALSAVLFGGLQAASIYLPVATAVPRAAILLLNGMIALLVTVRAGDVIRSRLRQRTR